MRRMCRQSAHRPMLEGGDSWAFAIGRIESMVMGQFVQTDPLPRALIISQKCTAALESCLFSSSLAVDLVLARHLLLGTTRTSFCIFVFSLSVLPVSFCAN